MIDEQIEARAQGFRAGFQAGMSRAVEWVETHRLRVQYPPDEDAVVLRALREVSAGIRTEMESGTIGESELLTPEK